MFDFEEVHEDARGKLIAIVEKGKQICLLVNFNVDAPRGGHSHTNPETMSVIYGEIECLLKNLNNDTDEIKSIIREGDTVHIKPGVAHLFIAKTPALLLEIKRGGHEIIEYKPYRDKVREFLAKHK